MAEGAEWSRVSWPAQPFRNSLAKHRPEAEDDGIRSRRGGENSFSAFQAAGSIDVSGSQNSLAHDAVMADFPIRAALFELSFSRGRDCKPLPHPSTTGATLLAGFASRNCGQEARRHHGAATTASRKSHPGAPTRIQGPGPPENRLDLKRLSHKIITGVWA